MVGANGPDLTRRVRCTPKRLLCLARDKLGLFFVGTMAFEGGLQCRNLSLLIVKIFYAGLFYVEIGRDRFDLGCEPGSLSGNGLMFALDRIET